MRFKNLVLVILVLLLIFAPLFLKRGAEFGGADDRAEQAITQLDPDYKPWFSSIWEPPSGEVESLLFAAQAAIGAGFIGYYLGYARGRRERFKSAGQPALRPETKNG